MADSSGKTTNPVVFFDLTLGGKQFPCITANYHPPYACAIVYFLPQRRGGRKKKGK